MVWCAAFSRDMEQLCKDGFITGKQAANSMLVRCQANPNNADMIKDLGPWVEMLPMEHQLWHGQQVQILEDGGQSVLSCRGEEEATVSRKRKTTKSSGPEKVKAKLSIFV